MYPVLLCKKFGVLSLNLSLGLKVYFVANQSKHKLVDLTVLLNFGEPIFNSLKRI